MSDAGSSPGYGAVEGAELADDEDDLDLAEDDEEVDDEEVGDANGSDRAAGGLSGAVLDYVARALVDDPDAVVVDTTEGRAGGVTLRLHVAPDDMGKVIGKRGRVAQALRAVVRAAGAKEGVDTFVDIVD